LRALMTATRSDYCQLHRLQSSDSSRWTIRNALVEYGWSVDHRVVRVGEDLDGYDLIIVEANDPRGPKTWHHLGTLWALVQDWNGGPPVLLNWDHWDIKRIWRGLVNEIAPTEVPSGPRTDVVQARQYQEVLERQMDMWSEGEWQQSLVCAFKWGDHDKIFNRTNVTNFATFDPSWDQPIKRMPTGAVRERRWVCASLTNHKDWIKSMDLKWPVECYGPGYERIERDDLIERYKSSWGLLSPKYYHVGSGYWRARLAHGPLTGTITLCNPKEVPFDSYHVGDIEEMSDQELHELREAQISEMTESWTGREETIVWLGTFLKQIAARPRDGEPLPVTGQSSLL